jgi:putative phosphoribosyl transferase
VELTGRTVVLVDDGVATGATARAACEVVRALGARAVVLAVPVGHPEAMTALGEVADQVVCLECPSSFSAVGGAYRDFTQVSDDEVVALLATP